MFFIVIFAFYPGTIVAFSTITTVLGVESFCSWGKVVSLLFNSRSFRLWNREQWLAGLGSHEGIN